MGERRGVYRVWAGKSEERRPLERLRLDGEIILKWIIRKWDGGMDWIILAQDRVRRWALFNAVMNFGVP
jgi:hypothetical protein